MDFNLIEKTLGIIGPAGMPHAALIRDQLILAGFTILKQEDMRLSPEVAAQFGAKAGLEASKVHDLSSGQSRVMVIAKQNAIRDLVGFIEEEREIAGGWKRLSSVMHASASAPQARWEIKSFFPQVSTDSIPSDKEARDFVQDNLKPVLVQALTELCKAKPERPTKWLAEYLLEHNPNKPRTS